MAEIKPIQVLVNGELAGKTIKELKGEVSNLARELGLLAPGSEAWVKKTQEFTTVKQRLADINEESRKVQDAMKGFDLSKFGEAGGLIQRIQNQFGDLKGGIGSAVQSFGLLKTAIAGTGIGLLILAFTALVSWFSKTDEGAKKMEGLMNALRFVTSILTKGLNDLGEKLFWAFEHPKEAMNELYEFVKQNLINRFTAFKVILEGIMDLDFKKVGNGIIQAGTGIENATDKLSGLIDKAGQLGDEMLDAAKKGMALAELHDLIEKREAKVLSTNAKALEQVDRLIFLSKDRTKTEAERIAMLDKANVVEKNRIAELVQVLKLKLDLARQEYEQAKKSGTQNDEMLRAVKEAEAAISDAQKESVGQLDKINSEKLSQMDAYKAAREAKEKEALGKQKEFHDAELEAIKKQQDIEAQLIEDETQRKERLLEIQRDREIEAVEHSKASAERRVELIMSIEEKFGVDLAKLQSDAAKAEKDRAEKAAKEDLELRRRQAQARADLELELAQQAANKAALVDEAGVQDAAEERLLQAKIARIKTLSQLELEDTQKTEDEKKLIKEKALIEINNLEEQAAQAKRERNAQEASNILQGFSTVFTAIAEFSNIQSQKELSRLDKDKAARLKSLDDEYKKGRINKESYERSKSDIESGFAEKTKAIKKRQAVEQKNWSIAQAVMQGAIAVLAASANPLGIWSPQAIATAVMAGVNIAKVAATPVPEFAKGGVLNGPSHSNGGMKVIDGAGRAVAEIEGGEPILSRATYQNNPDLVNLLLDSSINRGGAKVYVDPGLLKSFRYETGGILPGGQKVNGQGGSNSDAILEELRAMRLDSERQHQELINTLRNVDTLLKAYVVIDEIGDGLNDLRTLKRSSNGSTTDGWSAFGPVILNDKLF